MQIFDDHGDGLHHLEIPVSRTARAHVVDTFERTLGSPTGFHVAQLTADLIFVGNWRSTVNRRYDLCMSSYILLIALIAGLLMYLLSANAKVVRIGEMLLFSSILGLLIALAPLTVSLLQRA